MHFVRRRKSRPIVGEKPVVVRFPVAIGYKDRRGSELWRLGVVRARIRLGGFPIVGKIGRIGVFRVGSDGEGGDEPKIMIAGAGTGKKAAGGGGAGVKE